MYKHKNNKKSNKRFVKTVSLLILRGNFKITLDPDQEIDNFSWI